MSTGIVGGSLGACHEVPRQLDSERESFEPYLEIGLPLLMTEEGGRA
jgi:hypothetical protein